MLSNIPVFERKLRRQNFQELEQVGYARKAKEDIRELAEYRAQFGQLERTMFGAPGAHVGREIEKFARLGMRLGNFWEIFRGLENGESIDQISKQLTIHGELEWVRRRGREFIFPRSLNKDDNYFRGGHPTSNWIHPYHAGGAKAAHAREHVQ